MADFGIDSVGKFQTTILTVRSSFEHAKKGILHLEGGSHLTSFPFCAHNQADLIYIDQHSELFAVGAEFAVSHTDDCWQPFYFYDTVIQNKSVLFP